MREFDLEVWKERAWTRYCRAHVAAPSNKESELAWALEVLAISDLSKLVDWCKERKLKVGFAKKPNGTYHSQSKEIIISSRLSIRNQVTVLLHECGHHLIGINDDHDRFGMGYPQSDPEITKTFHHRVSCLEEELEAWHRGWKLSKRLDLRIDRDHFDSIRLKCIRSYVKWTLKPGTFKKTEDED
jgi:hypothetical protein